MEELLRGQMNWRHENFPGNPYLFPGKDGEMRKDCSAVVRFRTKGDANETEDGGLVHYKNVIGTPVFTIPYLGFVANYIQHPPGMYVAISAGAVLLMLTFLPDIFAPDSKSETVGEDEKKRANPAAGRHVRKR